MSAAQVGDLLNPTLRGKEEEEKTARIGKKKDRTVKAAC